MKNCFLALLFCATLALSCFAQKINPVSGGSRIETVKKQVFLIAENESVRLTLTTDGKHGKQFSGMTSVYLKIENLTDAPLSIQTSKFSAVDDEGRGYAGLEFSEAMKRFLDGKAGFLSSMSIALSGRHGKQQQEAAERSIIEDTRKVSLVSGEIPPKSFKDGAVYFEAPLKKKKYTLKILLGSLWAEPFIFSTEK